MPGVSKVNLTVAEDNDRARALYASEGFTVFAREEDAFRNGVSSCVELTMTRQLP